MKETRDFNDLPSVTESIPLIIEANEGPQQTAHEEQNQLFVVFLTLFQ